MELNYSPYTSTLNPGGNQYLLLQNQPNPFTAETAIGFVLPGACAAQLRVFDATGRLLWQRDGEYPVGYSAETLRLDGLAASGVLFYELTTPFGTLTKRMVRVGN
ncbi:MAG: T9SS type A sorting domain-containing protein [Lewinellaceae bacterium]|nr:T9SS type A sorting domain-containing protein [Lewinellaceae bacterium]